MVGTRRGAFILESDLERAHWDLRGPLANAGWSFNCVRYNPADGTIYAAGHNAWYGAAVWRSRDYGETWSLSSEGISYGDDGPSIRQIWQIEPCGGAIYAGVDPAGLFRSDDGGATWTEAGAPLRFHPDAPAWRPGKGGLPVHSIVPHPAEPGRLWLAVAGGGVLYTADGGRSWEPRNPMLRPDTPARHAQKLAMAPGMPDRLFQQNHAGVFRTDDGGRTWSDVTAGVPTAFGFALAVHPRAPGTVYTIPHENQGGSRYMPGYRLAVWRTRDGGERWTRLDRGLPREPTFASVLREGLAADSLEPAGVYFGTSSGHLIGSFDEGESWTILAPHLPEIHAVSVAVVHT